MLNFSLYLKKKNLAYPFYFVIIIVGISIYSALYFMSGTRAGVSADGNFTIEPVTPGTDDIVGGASTQWTYSVTTTQNLVAGDVIRFYFPTSSLATPFDISSATTSAISGITLYSSIATTTYNSSILTDGGIETWDTTPIPDDWVFTSTLYDYLARSVDRNSGSYSLALTSYSNQEGTYLSPQLVHSGLTFTNNDLFQFRFYGKRSVGTPNVWVYYLYADELDNAYAYNFTGVDAGTWTAVVDGPGSDQIEIISLSDAWAQRTSTPVTAPASGVAFVDVGFFSAGSENDVALYDDMEFLVNSVNTLSLSNGNFETWNTIPTSPASWATGSFINISGGAFGAETSIVHGGTYAAKSTWGWDASGNVYNYISTSTASLTPGDTYRVSAWSRANDSASVSARLSLAVFNGPVSSATQVYDFYNNGWIAYTTSTNPAWNETGVQEEQRFVTTGTYQEFTSESFVVPASGNITIALYGKGDKVGDVYDVAYIDDVTLRKAVDTVESAGITYSATSTLLYGMVSSTITSGTAFSVTFDGITNGQDTQANVTDLVWRVEAGTPTLLLEPWGSLSETKFTISAADSLVVPVPTVPASLATSTVDTTSIGITWTDASSDETGFIVQKSTDGLSYTTVTTTAANATSTTLTGLTPNTGYYVRVAATNSYGDSSYATMSIEYTLAAAPVSATSAATSATEIEVSWGANSNPTSTVYYITDSLLDTATTTETSLTYVDLTPNTSYEFSIKAAHNDGTFTSSVTTSAYTQAAVPTSVSASAASATSIAISWNANSNSAGTVFQISGDGFSTVTTTATSTTLTELTPNTSYTVNVKAQNNDSTYTSAGTDSEYTNAAIPTSVSVAAASSVSLSITWGANSNAGGTIYQVSGVGFSTVTTTATTQILTGLTPNTNYAVSVKAQHNDGTYTSAASDTEYTLSAIPTTVSASAASATSITVVWDVNSNPDGTIFQVSGTGFDTSTTTDTSKTITGLTPNTSYTISLKAQHNDGTFTSAATDSDYANAAVPASVSGTANGQTSIIVTWGANSNAASTVYELYDAGENTTIATTTDTSYTVVGLTAATAYTFKVRALYNSDNTTWSSFSAASSEVTTASVGTSVEMTLNVGATSTFQFTGGTSHTATLNSVVEGVSANVTIESTPVTQDFSEGVADTIDTDGNGADDMTVTVSDITASGSTITLASYTPPAAPETPAPSSGGGGAVTVNTPVLGPTPISYNTTLGINNIVLNFSVQNATQVAISDNPSFVGSSWQTYQTQKNVPLNTSETTKILYIKFRSSSGGETAVQKLTIQINPSIFIPNPDPVEPSELVGADSSSLVKISNLNRQSLVQGQYLSFKYYFINNTGKTLPIKVTRSLVNSTGKAVLVSNATGSLKPGGKFSRSISQNLSTRLSPGVYKQVINFYDSRTGKKIAENSFEIIVEKKKVRQAILSATVENTGKSIVFDPASLKVLKKPVTLPYSFRLKYSFKNQNSPSGYFDLVREIVDENGKVWQKNTGLWKSNKGQVRNINIGQTIPNSLPAGNYLVRIRFSPQGKAEIAGENSFSFTITDK